MITKSKRPHTELHSIYPTSLVDIIIHHSTGGARTKRIRLDQCKALPLTYKCNREAPMISTYLSYTSHMIYVKVTLHDTLRLEINRHRYDLSWLPSYHQRNISVNTIIDVQKSSLQYREWDLIKYILVRILIPNGYLPISTSQDVIYNNTH